MLEFLVGWAIGALTVVAVLFGIARYYARLVQDKYLEATQRSARLSAFSAASEEGERTDMMVKENRSSRKHLSGHVKFQTHDERQKAMANATMSLLSASGHLKLSPWCYVTLKGNMLFRFANEQAEGSAQIVCLDGCTVNTTDTNFAAKTTAITIESERDLFAKDVHKIYISFVNGKELEEWYHALQRASTMSSNMDKIQHEDEHLRSYFSGHVQAVIGESSAAQNNAAWCNAILARLWWQFQDNRGFQRFISHGLAQRIKKMTDFPSFIESMTLESMVVGSNLPMISNAALGGLTEWGELNVEMDVEYQAGLEMTIGVNTSMQLPGASIKVPASATVRIKKLNGRMRMHVSPPPCDRFWIGFVKEPTFDIEAETKIGTGGDDVLPSMVAMANNMLKRTDLTNVLVNKLKTLIINDTMVLPNMDEWPLPFWPYDAPEDNEPMGVEFFKRVVEVEDAATKPWYLRKGGILDVSPSGISFMGKNLFMPYTPGAPSTSSATTTTTTTAPLPLTTTTTSTTPTSPTSATAPESPTLSLRSSMPSMTSTTASGSMAYMPTSSSTPGSAPSSRTASSNDMMSILASVPSIAPSGSHEDRELRYRHAHARSGDNVEKEKEFSASSSAQF